MTHQKQPSQHRTQPPTTTLFPEGYRQQGPALRLHKAGHDPRAAALMVVYRVLGKGEDSQACLDTALRAFSAAPSDKRLCTELVYGALRSWCRLDHFAAGFLRTPGKLPFEMRLALLLCLYEMVCLRIPEYAGVHWTVSHIRGRFGQGLGKVANGALRSMQRERAAYETPDTVEEADMDGLSLRYAMPRWITALWQAQYGNAAALAFLKASSCTPPSGLRINMARPEWRSLLSERTSSATLLSPAGLCFSGALPPGMQRIVDEGKASRQSPASYAILQSLQPEEWPQPIWDCCAGRGGKTLALLEQGIAVARASDPQAKRIQSLEQEYARLGMTRPPCPTIGIYSADSPDAVALDNAGLFGTVLVDAPCSGLGTLARRPEIRLRRTQEDCAELVSIQRAILSAVWPRIRPGGRLVYITCTINRAENDGQIAAFIADHADARLLHESQVNPEHAYGEFFYGAIVEKTG